jgi:O-succinylbenzoic acid--CoA ligase
MKLSVFDVAARHPSALALITPEARFSYAELAARVSATAAELATRGLLEARAEPVAVVARPGVSCVCVLHALWAYGVATFTLPARLPAQERLAWAARAEARAIVDPADVDSLSVANPPPLPAELAPEAPFAIVPTSGSAGAPKLVVLSRGAFSASARASAANLPLDQQDRWLLCLPLSHIGGLSILTRCLLSASAVVAFDPGREGLLARLPALATCLEREQVSLVSLVPTLLDALLALAPPWQPGPALRAVLLGGAATHAELLARARQRGVPVLVTYGLTESCSQVATTRVGSSPRVAAGLVSVGPALPGIELKIDESARICVRGPTLCTRFVDGESPVDEHGWLRTEDRGYLDRAGELFVLGRVSDVIISGGENVDPVRVEAALASAPGVRGAAVFGVPDPRFGELVVCALVPSGDFAPSRVRAALERVLAPHELPRQLALLDALPELPNGKLDRTQVRTLATASLAPWPRSGPRPPTLV